MDNDLRLLDISLAEKLFGINVFDFEFSPHYREDNCTREVPRFSTDATAMLTVIEKMRERGWNFHADNASGDGGPWTGEPRIFKYGCRFRGATCGVEIADTLPLAVARAAMAALESK